MAALLRKTRSLPGALILAATASAGCGGSGASLSGPGSPSDAASSLDAPSGATDAAPDGVVEANKDVLTGDGPDTGATDASDASAPDTRLWPLEVGRSWTYDVQTLGTSNPCATGAHVETILSQSSVDGRSAFQDQTWCALSGTINLSQSGEEVDLDYQGSWIVVLGLPVQEGTTWTSTGPINYTWHDAGTVTVPAGTFSSCWTRTQNVTYTAYTVFCRGVGLVRDYSMDFGGNGWDTKLTAKSF